MPATFCLSANDGPHEPLGRALLLEALGPAQRPRRGCVIGAAHGDDPRRNRAMVAALRELLGGPCSAPALSDPGLDPAEAADAIARADVLFCDGGDTLELVRAVVERGLVASFRAAAAGAGVLFGLSAGACAFSALTIGYDEEERARVAACLELGVPWPVDVHAEDDDWSEMRALLHLLEGAADPVGLVIPTGAAVLLRAGRASSRGAVPAELRRLGPGGAWRVEPLATV